MGDNIIIESKGDVCYAKGNGKITMNKGFIPEKRVIWEYDLHETHNKVKIPRNGEIRFVGNQRETVCLFIEVNPNNELVERRFNVYNTGHEFSFSYNEKYIGSVIIDNGNYALHVYEAI